MEETSDSIRALAAKWSLAGDETLLNLLQNTHQRIVSKCQEVNTKLSEMTTALDDASINLQNVNNKFMALSNSQFIESRVYEDDDVTPTQTQEAPTPEVIDELDLLKQSLAILENAHESARILDDSDTDDSDAEISVVLKLKDAYAHRPLPYIIGSQSWRNKWHAGLVIEDSDSESSTCRHDEREMEQYSDSENEDLRTDRHPEQTISETSSSFHSERDKDISEPLTPAAIAAELARRLGQPATTVIEAEEEFSPPEPTTKAVYKPHKPVTSTIFSDEPPPIDNNEQSDSQDDDIFAEINKNKPYNSNNKVQSNLAEDLFGFGDVPYENNDILTENKEEKENSAIFDEKPELFEKQPQKIAKDSKNVEEDGPKKPVGGISLFGSNKGTESIGAAILKRNRKKSSSSENEIKNDIPEPKHNIRNEVAAKSDNKTKEKDIFDSLFAKSERKGQKNETAIAEVKEVKRDIKDLFSDNIFDDIDDIFTSNIKIPTKEANKNAKSIFDDDDDLFSDIAEKPTESKTSSKETKITSKDISKKSIFESEDELFDDVKITTKESTKKVDIRESTKGVATESQINKDVPGHFTSEEKTTNLNIVEKSINFDDSPKKLISKPKSKSIFDSDSDEETTTPQIVKTSPVLVDSQPKPKESNEKTKTIFDSDSDDDLFSDINIKSRKVDKEQESNKNININTDVERDLFNEAKSKLPEHTLKSNENAKVFQSPSLFEEDEIDDLFINANKAKVEIIEIPKNEHVLKDTETVKDISDINNEKTEEFSTKVPGIVETKPYIFPKNNVVEPKVFKRIVEEELGDDIFTKSKEIDTNKDNSPFMKDVIETSQDIDEPIKVQSKSNPIEVIVESKLHEPDKKDTYEKPVEINKDALITEPQKSRTSKKDTGKNPPIDLYQNEPLFDEPAKEKRDETAEQQKKIPHVDIFDDIFREPPAFEKAKETKKVTNVNALFEDDSDDEALFFKKNDVISDEKPEIFTPNANFGIFNDEPPALDADFATQSKNYGDDDIFSSISKSNKTALTFQKNEPHFDERTEVDKTFASEEPPSKNKLFDAAESNIFGSQEAPNIIDNKQPTVSLKDVPDSDDDLFNTPVPERSIKAKENIPKLETKDLPDNATKQKEIDDTENRKIGKLNTQNFNINVQALVPGASPKKSITKNLIDNNSNVMKDSSINKDPINAVKDIKTDNKNIRNVVDKTEVDNAEKVVKSINFDSKPDTGVLDNNVSKQRAKIQVKRRPSSRRARHEAVRKSVIDIDDDTDNSSSFDEPRSKIKDKNDLENLSEYKNQVEIEKSEVKLSKNDDIFEKIDKNNDRVKESDKANISVDIRSGISQTTQISVKSNDEVDSMPKSEKDENVPKSDDSKIPSEDLQKSPQSTTKVVYVLNDEDIFSNKTETSKNTAENDDEYIFKTIKNDDDLFKSNSKGVMTIGNTDKEVNKSVTTEKDTVSSKNIQENKIRDKNTEISGKNAKSLFDLSDDDDELFGKSKKTRKVEPKSKLFDSDSEDDLFGGKKERGDKKEVMKERDVKKSLFGDDVDDVDDDLFGAKTASFPDSSVAASLKSAAKTTEPVFDDPLSMADD